MKLLVRWSRRTSLRKAKVPAKKRVVRRRRLYYSHQLKEFFEVQDRIDAPDIGPVIPEGFAFVGEAKSSIRRVIREKLKWLRKRALKMKPPKNMLNQGVDMTGVGKEEDDIYWTG